MVHHIFRALTEKSFRLLWIGEILTQISINLFSFILILVVFSLTKSNTAVSGVVITYTIPAIVFGIIAGVYVDRWNKKKILIISNVSRAVLLIILAFTHMHVAAVYSISFLVSIFTQFFIPAESPMIPLLVRKDHLISANALFGLGIYGSILLGFVLSGPLLIALGETGTLLLLAGLLLLGSVCIAAIRMPKSYEKSVHETQDHPLQSKRAVFSEVRIVVGILTKTKHIYHAFVLLAISQILILIIAVLTPGYATEVLGIPIKQFPLTFIAPAALGMLVGAVVLTNVFHKYRKEKIMTIGLFVSGIAMLILPYCNRVTQRDFFQSLNATFGFEITIIHMMVLLAFLLGLANAFVFVPSNTILQEETSEELRGKIYGFLNTAVGVFSLLPVILVGSLSDIIGVGNVITVIGISLLLLGFARRYVLKL